jgi:predicted MFS family arabinose efflux permease
MTLRERVLLATLAAVQFVHVLDSLIVMPLAPELMRDMMLGTGEFGALVSSYNLSAAVAGLLGAFLLDHFDRKKALLVLFTGLFCGTLVCGLSSGVYVLFTGRIIAGACGGLIQALLFAIIGDCFKETKRGAATGIVMSSFSVATVLGVPISLFLVAHGTWRLPFLVLGFLGFVITIVAAFTLPPLRGHLTFVAKTQALMKRAQADSALPATSFSVFLLKRNTRYAFLLIITLMFAGFTVIPYMSAYLVSNLKLSHEDLATVFFAGGVATFATARLVGGFADRFGKRKVYTVLALASAFPTLALTHLTHVPMLALLFVTTTFTLLIAARGIPALAMVTASVGPGLRGRFLSLTSSVQQASSGLASFFSGFLLNQGTSGQLLNYNWAGDLSVVFILLSVLIANQIRPVSN